MPLTGEYAPSPSDRSRDQVDRFEASGGTEANTLDGVPIIVLTSIGAKTGRLRKTPLMRVEHDGEYAVVASMGGAPNHPVWYHNLVAHPQVELQDGPVKRDYTAREVTGTERDLWWERACAVWNALRELPDTDDAADPGLRPHARRGVGRHRRGVRTGGRSGDPLRRLSSPRAGQSLDNRGPRGHARRTVRGDHS